MVSSSTSQNSLPPSARLTHLWPIEDRIEAQAQRVQSTSVWQPIPDSPQRMAYLSDADELFFGGAAGGGKSDLIVGMAGTKHRRSAIFRREFPLVRALVERSREVYNASGATHSKDSYNEQLHLWRLMNDRLVEFCACQHEKDKEKQRGRARDFYGFDEITEFTEGQYRFITAWNRSTYVDPRTGKPQRCRVVATGNPPTTSDGEWVIAYWGPWLQEDHLMYPTPPGELRWVARIKDEDVWFMPADVVCEDGRSFVVVDGTRYSVRSRTFIPAKLADNPYLRDTEYGAIIDSLPEPLRSQMRDGLFNAAREADPWQVIPTEWVKAAMGRSLDTQPDSPQTAVGVDVAHGGKDKTIIARCYGAWVAPLIKYPGVVTPLGQDAAMLVVQALEGAPILNIDAIGYGASCADALIGMGIDTNPVNVGASAVTYDERGQPMALTDQSGRLRFKNWRTALYWMAREALDPQNDAQIALPEDRELLADLCAAKYKMMAGGVIQVESKDEIKSRIGRSPDCGDAVLLALAGALLLPPEIQTEGTVVYDERVHISSY